MYFTLLSFCFLGVGVLTVTEELKEYVSANYKVKNNQGYSFVVIRSQSEEGIDGWIAFYHYSKKAKPADLYYIYYFCIEF